MTGSAPETVGAGVARERVVAALAEEKVASVVPDHDVVPGPTVDEVALVGAGERVVAGSTDDDLRRRRRSDRERHESTGCNE